MGETDKNQAEPSDNDPMPTPASGPLVFISHDSRDADLAEAFSKLLRSVSAGMLKSFRSSDKKGEGIDFGDEWYRSLMEKLQSASDVVCLFTERSLDRPWILYEAGVAKGTLKAPVQGIALGVPLTRVSTGPFYQFQNSDDTEDDLTTLVQKLARRVPGLELDPDVLSTQVQAFKSTADAILRELAVAEGKGGKKEAEENPVARLAEEMKALPSRVAERLIEDGEPTRRRRTRRFHPMMFEEMLHMSGEYDDPVGILVAASFVRDDMPWLYELAVDAYRAVRSGDRAALKREMERFTRTSELLMRRGLMEDLGFGGKEAEMWIMEFPRMLEHMMHCALERPSPAGPRKSQLPVGP